MANEEQPEEVITISDTSRFTDDMFPYYLKETFSDVTLIVDGQRIHAHKIVLAARCKFFESLLCSDPKQCELAIEDVSPKAFIKILKFIYTGSITIISSDGELIFNILKLAHEYSLKNLRRAMNEKMSSILDMTNICTVLNNADLHDMDELRKLCHNFIDEHISEVLDSDFFNVFTQKFMIKLLERDSFLAPEIEVFKIVEKWCKMNEDVDNLVIQCVRLSCLTSEEILSIVWPSKLVENEKLLDILAEMSNGKVKPQYRTLQLVKNENLAIQDKACVISCVSLSDHEDLAKSVYHHFIDDENGITVDLGKAFYFNYIKMRLKDDNERYYHYYIEVSFNQKNWYKVVDYSKYNCRSYQNLYFDRQVARYIRNVGKYSSVDEEFQLLSLGIYLKSEVPKVLNQIVCPAVNVATPESGALVIDGRNKDCLINGDTQHYIGSAGYTFHYINGHIVVQLAQPYMISRMKLPLWDQDSRSYRYFIETSVNSTDWEIAVDRRNEDCQSWQNLRFKERAVVFVKIKGTHNTANSPFHCFHFEWFFEAD